MLSWSHNHRNITKKIALQTLVLEQQGQCPAARFFFPCLGQSLRTTPKILKWSVSKGMLCPRGACSMALASYGNCLHAAWGVHIVHFIDNVVSDGVQLVLLGILSHAPEALTRRPAKVLRLGTHSRPPPPPCPLSVRLQSPKTFPSRMCNRPHMHLHLRQLKSHTNTGGIRKENVKPWA